MKHTTQRLSTWALIALFSASLALPTVGFAKGFSGGGSRSFSAPSRSFAPAPRAPSPSPAPAPAPAARPMTVAPAIVVAPPPPAERPRITAPTVKAIPDPAQPIANAAPYVPKGDYDAGAAQAARDANSRAKYLAANPPAKVEVPKAVARDLTYQRMERRAERQQQTYGQYQHAPAPVVIYRDNYNTLFWLMMMDRSAQDRAMWYYHHSNQVDPARMAELRARDAEFDQRLRQIEAQKVKPDASYAPSGVDRDLMYRDDVVKKTYVEKESSGFPWGWLLGIALLAGLGYLIFGVRFKLRS